MLTKIKNWAVIFGFIISTIAAYFSLLLGYPLQWFSQPLWRAWMDIYKGCFGMLLISMISLTSPARVRIYSPHENMRFRTNSKTGLLQSTLSPRALITANHQIYSDWMFLWWLAYTAGLETAPVAVLKKSLRAIPVIGWAMRWLKFLFLSRKWSDDEVNIRDTTAFLAEDRSWPLWLMIFPEGTVYNRSTHSRSEMFADKEGISRSMVPEKLLLPRVKGLQAILKGMKGAVPVLYDITVVYEPTPPQSIAAENQFSLGRTFVQGKGPSLVKMHVREFPGTQIPYNESEEVFTSWLYERWMEKDKIYQSLAAGQMESEFRAEAPVRPNSWFEVYKCYQMPFIFLLATHLLYQLVSTVFA